MGLITKGFPQPMRGSSEPYLGALGWELAQGTTTKEHDVYLSKKYHE